ncbi:MAG: radical SAM protein [Candidatus Lokiarchaeota archaeon]|nr:radical SAM protein [Candidatus Lokiarchaeota archaeon]MBD3342680.1 radical SAM protein [Candidatus Lokiarchaeota archaeon]
MIDHEGFVTLFKRLQKATLQEREKKFAQIFFNEHTPNQVKLKLNKNIKFSKNAPMVTESPILIDLSLNNYCNLKCPYCYMSANSANKGEHLSTNNFNMLLRQMIESRVLQVALGGGEPTFHPNFTEILEKIRKVGDIVPNYTTNGTNLTPDILTASKKYCGAVAVSYSEKREQETLEAVKRLINSGIQTNLHIVMLKSRVPNLSIITEKYARLGIHSVVLLLFKPMGRGAKLKSEIITLRQKKDLTRELIRILTLQKKYGVRLALDACSAFCVRDFPFLAESIDGCTGATYSAYIDWEAKIKPCSFMQLKMGVDLKNSTIKDAWHSQLFINFRNTLLNPRYEGCEDCSFFPSCWGGCPIEPNLVYCIERGNEKTIKNQ